MNRGRTVIEAGPHWMEAAMRLYSHWHWSSLNGGCYEAIHQWSWSSLNGDCYEAIQSLKLDLTEWRLLWGYTVIEAGPHWMEAAIRLYSHWSWSSLNRGCYEAIQSLKLVLTDQRLLWGHTVINGAAALHDHWTSLNLFFEKKNSK